ncbi:hypothetical protein LEP1GSC191_1437 [Leptospira borgpetersenii serovar Mini str. 201000851]|uniref:Uncharacterized protein n=3 Tax=Leptospira borgpetersenii TaxID=174 RepID=M3HSC4_LEPBO|nr:hypothetical protein LEP1GSC128_1453 [Leptospira borgpetersenii str. 200801926]EMG00500.1 hypothetical protein LEP1GSC123_2773 [Leptospira borgpetersenii str. 200701203]EMK12379.1 hypothetical protein LEP1GSC066_3210 [Leptospira sp. serovar Kenya str. Sh9]EMN13394.1 hypothetical protein LEP1GSC055_0971 [Leptospira borgpetersenii str. Brem 307]EMN19282.1 hypothetical protein LEP1GSC056_1804 [Leptospira borgpetersenii str. Brem 328]ENO63995.1 hypothetical protein LEP1GSC191_1437 [Leptospira b
MLPDNYKRITDLKFWGNFIFNLLALLEAMAYFFISPQKNYVCIHSESNGYVLLNLYIIERPKFCS